MLRMAAVWPLLSARRDRQRKMKKAAGNPVRGLRRSSCELRVGKRDGLVAGDDLPTVSPDRT